MKLTKNKIIALAAVVVVLGASFIWGGGYAKAPVDALPEAVTPVEQPVTTEPAPAETVKPEQVEKVPEPVVAPIKVPEKAPAKTPPKQVINPDTGKDKYLTDPVPEGKPAPTEPENAEITDTALTCTLSVRCDVILDNLTDLDPEKTELVPEDGVIFAESTVTFYEGESVFNVLAREMKAGKIHLEFTNTPIYNSSYIEGIGNLYEFDCGELSGWMYKVNGWFPNYGSSRYELKQDDKIEWIYTCDLGRDIGGDAGFQK